MEADIESVALKNGEMEHVKETEAANSKESQSSIEQSEQETTHKNIEENKENLADIKSSEKLPEAENSVPMLRLVPLEQLLAAKNAPVAESSSIIVLDDSENSENDAGQKRGKSSDLGNKRAKVQRSNSTSSSVNSMPKKSRRTSKKDNIDEDNEILKRPTRQIRLSKLATMEKIKMALVSSSSSSSPSSSEIEELTSRSEDSAHVRTKRSSRLARSAKSTLANILEQPLSKKNNNSKPKSQVKSSKVSKKRPDKTMETIDLSSNNSDSDSFEYLPAAPKSKKISSKRSVPAKSSPKKVSSSSGEDFVEDKVQQKNDKTTNSKVSEKPSAVPDQLSEFKKKRIVVRLKRSTALNKALSESYEISKTCKESLTESIQKQVKPLTNCETAKSDGNSTDDTDSEKIKNLSSISQSVEKLIENLNSSDSDSDILLGKLKKIQEDKTSTPNLKSKTNGNHSSNNDSLEEIIKAPKSKSNESREQKIDEKLNLDNFKKRKLKIRVKRLHSTIIQNHICAKQKENNEKKKAQKIPQTVGDEETSEPSNEIKTVARKNRIKSLSLPLSSKSSADNDGNTKNTEIETSCNKPQDSISNSSDDSQVDDTINNKKKLKKMSSSDTNDEDFKKTNQISNNNSSDEDSDVIRKRPATKRSTRAQKRLDDDEYIADSDNLDDDDEPTKSNNDDDDDDDADYGMHTKKKTRKKPNKRKRIKKASDSSDDEAGGSNKKRRNIRKLIKTKELNLDTKQAAQEEKDRRKRIDERQKLYNSIYEKKESVEVDDLILDFDEETKSPLLKVDPGLMKLLKPHQAHGVKFMWDACFETLKAAEDGAGSGCILAHCMGLGKTLQVVALTHTLLTNSRKTNIDRVLVITPLSTLTNWAREYHHWLKSCKKKDIEIYDMSKFKDKNTRTFKLQEWFEEGGVCIMGYDMFRILSNEKTKGLRKKQREVLQQCLVDPGADMVICDEGHLLKNEKTSLSQAVTKMRTSRRIVLTGTPLQNNLKEYYCMIQFIKPNLLGTYKEYLNRFVNPITNGQYTDSTERDIRLMKQRSHILHTLLEGCIQRRDYSVLSPYLPPKYEYVIYITLSDVQKTLYEYYMTKQRDHNMDMSGKGAKLFQDFQNLRRIWTHPMSLRVNSDIAIKKKLLQDTESEEGSLKDFIDDHTTSESEAVDTDDGSFNSDKTVESFRKKTVIKTRSFRNAENNEDSDIEEVPIINKEDPSEWWCQMVPKTQLKNINHSPKLTLLMKILQECEQIGDKLLLFSQSLQSLDVIEEFLSFIDRKTRGDEEVDVNVNGFSGSWIPGADYFRLDGSSSVEHREAMCKSFNNTQNLRARLFLISTRAGSLGINLVAANRVIIFDVSWNPSHDTQSIFRVYRFGQEKPCYIYRFIAMGTMEQKVYERQVAKQAMAKRVIDEQQIGRHYNQNDLLELYTYELVPKDPREIPILPKDRLFADLLANYDKLVFKYHEHDSLLENQESDNLSEEERKVAWDEYEIEKSRPPQQQYVMYNRPNNFGTGMQSGQGPVTSNKIFGFRTDILLRLLNIKVARDHPTLSPTEIVQMVPSYLKQLYAEMNQGNPAMYKELLELHSQMEVPQGYFMNPLLYSNQNQPENQMVGGSTYPTTTMNGPIPTTSTEIVEID